MNQSSDQLAVIPSPEQARAALEALQSGKFNGKFADLSLGDLAGSGGLRLPEIPSLQLPEMWTGATPLAALCLLVVGVLIWLGGARLLKGGTVLLFGMLGASIAMLLEMIDGGAFTTRSLAAGSIGGLGGSCVGFLMTGVLSRMVCVGTGVGVAMMTLAFLGTPSTIEGNPDPDGKHPRQAQANETTQATPQTTQVVDWQSGRTVIRVAGPDQQRTQSRLDSLTRSLDEQRGKLKEATEQPGVESKDDLLAGLQTGLSDGLPDDLPEGWTADPARTIAAAGLGATCGLGVSFLFTGWSRRLAAASLGAALGVGAAAILLPKLGQPTQPVALAGTWLLLTVIRSAVPGQKTKSDQDDGG